MTTAQEGQGGAPGTTGPNGTTGTAATTGSASYERGAHRAPGYEQPVDYGRTSTAAVVGTMLAGVLMIISGLWSFFVGLTGIVKRQFYTTVPNYTFRLSIHGWGWIHMILGIVVLAAGVCVLLGMTWARVVGVALATISALANFLFIPYYPVWSLIVIALDVFIIWALVTGLQRQPA
jgi:hypothetical protein